MAAPAPVLTPAQEAFKNQIVAFIQANYDEQYEEANLPDDFNTALVNPAIPINALLKTLDKVPLKFTLRWLDTDALFVDVFRDENAVNNFFGGDPIAEDLISSYRDPVSGSDKDPLPPGDEAPSALQHAYLELLGNIQPAVGKDDIKEQLIRCCLNPENPGELAELKRLTGVLDPAPPNAPYTLAQVKFPSLCQIMGIPPRSREYSYLIQRYNDPVFGQDFDNRVLNIFKQAYTEQQDDQQVKEIFKQIIIATIRQSYDSTYDANKFPQREFDEAWNAHDATVDSVLRAVSSPTLQFVLRCSNPTLPLVELDNVFKVKAFFYSPNSESDICLWSIRDPAHGANKNPLDEPAKEARRIQQGYFELLHGITIAPSDPQRAQKQAVKEQLIRCYLMPGDQTELVALQRKMVILRHPDHYDGNLSNKVKFDAFCDLMGIPNTVIERMSLWNNMTGEADPEFDAKMLQVMQQAQQALTQAPQVEFQKQVEFLMRNYYQYGYVNPPRFIAALGQWKPETKVNELLKMLDRLDLGVAFRCVDPNATVGSLNLTSAVKIKEFFATLVTNNPSIVSSWEDPELTESTAAKLNYQERPLTPDQLASRRQQQKFLKILHSIQIAEPDAANKQKIKEQLIRCCLMPNEQRELRALVPIVPDNRSLGGVQFDALCVLMNIEAAEKTSMLATCGGDALPIFVDKMLEQFADKLKHIRTDAQRGLQAWHKAEHIESVRVSAPSLTPKETFESWKSLARTDDEFGKRFEIVAQFQQPPAMPGAAPAAALQSKSLDQVAPEEAGKIVSYTATSKADKSTVTHYVKEHKDGSSSISAGTYILDSKGGPITLEMVRDMMLVVAKNTPSGSRIDVTELQGKTVTFSDSAGKQHVSSLQLVAEVFAHDMGFTVRTKNTDSSKGSVQADLVLQPHDRDKALFEACQELLVSERGGTDDARLAIV